MAAPRVPPDTDLVLGAGGQGVFAVPGWEGPDLALIQDRRLALGPGMSVIMVHETGEGWLEGTYEELIAKDYKFPRFIETSRLNIRVSPLVGVLLEYVRVA